MYDDERKLEIIRERFIERLAKISTWNDFKTFINNLTLTKVKDFIKNALQEQADWENKSAGVFSTKETNTLELKDEIENL